MTSKHDRDGDRRAMFLMGELEIAKRSLQAGPIGIVVRVALAVIFMNLIVISYAMLGTTGPVAMSALFLVALLTPWAYQRWKEPTPRSHAADDDRLDAEEVRQES